MEERRSPSRLLGMPDTCCNHVGRGGGGDDSVSLARKQSLFLVDGLKKMRLPAASLHKTRAARGEDLETGRVGG